MQKLIDPPFAPVPLDGPYARGLIGCWVPSQRRALVDLGPFNLNPTPAGTDNHAYGVGPWGPWFRAATSYSATSRYELPSRTGDLWYERLSSGHCTVLAVLQNVTTKVAWSLASLLWGSPVSFTVGNSSDAGGLILDFRVNRATTQTRRQVRLPSAASASWGVLAATSRLDRYVRGYWNGREITGGTTTLGAGTVSGSSSQAWVIGNDSDGGQAHPRPIALLAIWDRAMLPGEIAALSDNPSLIWDVPRAWPALGFVPVAGGTTNVAAAYAVAATLGIGAVKHGKPTVALAATATVGAGANKTGRPSPTVAATATLTTGATKKASIAAAFNAVADFTVSLSLTRYVVAAFNAVTAVAAGAAKWARPSPTIAATATVSAAPTKRASLSAAIVAMVTFIVSRLIPDVQGRCVGTHARAGTATGAVAYGGQAVGTVAHGGRCVGTVAPAGE